MLKQIYGHFESLHFTESKLGQPQVDGNKIVIPVAGLLPLKGHPLVSSSSPLAGFLVFHDPTSSRRTVTEYIGDSRKPDGFKEEYEIVDGPFPFSNESMTLEFAFEGILERPPAWVDWVIRARSFELVVELTCDGD